MITRAVFGAAAALGLLIGSSASASAAASGTQTQTLVRANVASLGAEADGGIIGKPSLSADGRLVAFASEASSLVPGDSGRWIDIFVRDQLTSTTRRVTVRPDGGEADGSSFCPALSADGRYLAFDSYASNLVPGDTSGHSNVFLYEMSTGRTSRVSSARSGAAPDGDSAFASVSADGRYVAFDSTATNLVAADTNDHGDVFVWDRASGAAVRASVSSAQGPAAGQGNGGSGMASISADGGAVAFVSAASNLVPGDTNRFDDIYVRDLARGRTVRASTASGGGQPQSSADGPSISADGRHVAFDTAWPLDPTDTDWTRDVYVRDLGTSRTRIVSAPEGSVAWSSERGSSYGAVLSRDGRYVAFTSFAVDLLAGYRPAQQSVYARDMRSGRVTQLSVDAAGATASGDSYAPAITPDGSHVAFNSAAADLVPFDTNRADDVFFQSLVLPVPPLVAVIEESTRAGSATDLRPAVPRQATRDVGDRRIGRGSSANSELRR